MSQTKKRVSTHNTLHSTDLDQNPKLLAISKLSGCNLYVKKFDDTVKYDEHLLGIGINALRIFLLDSFNRPNINSIQVDELIVRMENIDDIIVYYIFTGNPLDHEIKFNNFIKRLVTMDCWIRFIDSEFNIYKRDTKSISRIVKEIFGG